MIRVCYFNFNHVYWTAKYLYIMEEVSKEEEPTQQGST